jgi:hypothetical protein
MSATPGSKVRVDPIDPALDPFGPLPCNLVTHGIGKRLDRRRAVDAVAVPVEELVELPEGQSAVTGEDGQTGRAESTAVEKVGIGRDRRHRPLVVVRRSATLLRRDHRPEGRACLTEVAEQLPALSGQSLELGVDVVKLVEPVVPLDVDLDSLMERKARTPTSGKKRVL